MFNGCKSFYLITFHPRFRGILSHDRAGHNTADDVFLVILFNGREL
jgi:hypothetical protein